MRRLLLAATLGALFGCSNDVPGVTCSEGEPCEKGVCQDGICVDPSCPLGCTLVQDCVSGLCQEAFTGLEIVAPLAGTTVAPGVEVGVEVKLVRREGAAAAAPATLTLALEGPTAAEQTLPLAEGDLYRGPVVFPAAGSWTLQAKLAEAGLASEKVAVEVEVQTIECLPTCASPKDECVAGLCKPVLTGIEILSPAEGATRPKTVPVEVALQVRAGAYTPLPTEVTLSFKNTTTPATGAITLAKAAGEPRYTGELVAAASGTFELTASVPAEYGGLVSAKRTIQVDARPPTLTLTVHYLPRTNAAPFTRIDPAIGGNYVRRDEFVAITVTADEAVDPALTKLIVIDGAGATTNLLLNDLPAPAGAPVCPGDQSFCKVVGLKMWNPALKLPSSRGSFKLKAKAPDTAGNWGYSAESALAVTRFKWSAQLGGPLATSPAVTADGNVVVAVGSSNGAGGTTQAAHVRAIDPEATSFADLGELDFLAPSRLLLVSSATSSEGALPTTVVAGKTQGTGTESTSPVQIIQGGSATGMCPGQFAEAHEIALMTVEDVPYVVALVPATMGSARVAAAALAAPGTCILSTDTFYASSHPGIAVDGATVYVPGLTKLQSFTLAGGAFTKLTPETGRDGQHLGPIVTRLGIAGITSTLTSTVGEKGSVFLAPGAGADPRESLEFSMALRGLVSGSLHRLVATTDQSKLLVFLDTLDAAPEQPGMSGPVATWPTLGANGSVFVVTKAGTLEAKGLNENWTFDLGGNLGSLAAFSPALDCTRKVGVGVPGRAGVAYVGTAGATGTAEGTLVAVVTDSPGLDSPAAGTAEERLWPKWAHDSQNTANAATPLSDNSCR